MSIIDDVPHTIRITPVGYLMVCLCDIDGIDIFVGNPPLEGAELCGNHDSIKLESLVKMGVSCLLFTEVDDEIVPLRKD